MPIELVTIDGDGLCDREWRAPVRPEEPEETPLGKAWAAWAPVVNGFTPGDLDERAQTLLDQAVATGDKTKIRNAAQSVFDLTLPQEEARIRAETLLALEGPE